MRCSESGAYACRANAARRRDAWRLNNGTSWKRVVIAERRPRWVVDRAKGEKKEKWHEGVIYLLVYLFLLFLLSLSLPFFRSQTDDGIAAGARRPGNCYQGNEIRLYLCPDALIYSWICMIMRTNYGIMKHTKKRQIIYLLKENLKNYSSAFLKRILIIEYVY